MGGTFDRAQPGTLASQASYFLDFGRQNAGGLAWQPEATAAPRVSPDALLLPDGTVLVVSGGNYGVDGAPRPPLAPPPLPLPRAMHRLCTAVDRPQSASSLAAPTRCTQLRRPVQPHACGPM